MVIYITDLATELLLRLIDLLVQTYLTPLAIMILTRLYLYLDAVGLIGHLIFYLGPSLYFFDGSPLSKILTDLHLTLAILDLLSLVIVNIKKRHLDYHKWWSF